MNQNKIGEIIEKKRKEKNLTQKELANALGVSNTAVSKWENGNNLPDISMLEPLSRILDLDLLELISTQNELNEDCKEKLNKLKKVKISRIIALCLITINIICLTCIFAYNNALSKRKEEQSKAVEVYKISSYQDDYNVDGYIVFNDKESLIIIENILYQGREKSIMDYEKIDKAIFYIKIDQVIVLNKTISLDKEKIKNINDILSLNEFSSNIAEAYLKNNKINFNDAVMTLKITNTDGQNQNIDIRLKLTKEFT